MQPVTMDIEVSGFLLIEQFVGCWFCETPELPRFGIETPAANGPVSRGRVKVEGC
jgi:hypothetical protein